MLVFMRKHAKFFYVFFFIIIVSFIFLYVGPIHEKENIPVIEVGNKKIFMPDYWRVHDNLRNYYQNTFKGQFTPEIEKILNLKERAIDLIISNEILLIAAKRIGIETNDNELNDSIINDPAFKRDNVFREDVYNRVLQLNRMTIGFFEAKRREELTIQKIRRLIGLSSGVISSDLSISSSTDKKTLDSFTHQALIDSKDKAILSYINALKKTIPIKIRQDII